MINQIDYAEPTMALAFQNRVTVACIVFYYLSGREDIPVQFLFTYIFFYSCNLVCPGRVRNIYLQVEDLVFRVQILPVQTLLSVT